MYINPIELLGLSELQSIALIDSDIIKKEKRKLFAEIDLSDDGFFDYHGIKLNKGSCEKSIDELMNLSLRDFYFYLLSNVPLNNFLINGDARVFYNFKLDSIFKLSDFVNFISPYYAVQFDKALLNAFLQKDTVLLKSMFSSPKLFSQQNLNDAYKSLGYLLTQRIAENDKIKKEIEDEETEYDDDNISDIVEIVKSNFPSDLLNILPEYFQSQIVKIAKSINYLSNSIWDTFDTTQVPNDLTGYLLTLNIGGLDRPTFENNFKIISKKNNDRIEQAKNAPLLKKWAAVLINVRDTIVKVENKSTTSKEAFQNIKKLFDIQELNSLPSYADEIRSQIGYSIRNLSIAIWNKQSDIKNAIDTINLALQINLKTVDKGVFLKDLEKLNELKKERDETGEPVSFAPVLQTFNGIGTTIYGQTLYFVFFYIPIFPIARYNLQDINNGYRFLGKLKLHLWQKIWKYSVISIILFSIIIGTVK